MTASGFDVDYALFSARKTDNVAIVSFKENLPLHMIDIGEKELLLSYFNYVERSPDIKLLLLVGSSKKTQRRGYVEFYTELLSDEPGKFEKMKIERLFNAINQIIVRIVNCRKVVVHADSGNIVSLFLNISLACDYRIIGDQTVFQNPNLDIGLAPKGGGTYFLYQRLGHSRTLETLLSDSDISARAALDLGIVDRVVPSESINDEALNIVREFAERPTQLLSGVKQLLSYCTRDISGFLEFESAVLRRQIAAR